MEGTNLQKMLFTLEEAEKRALERWPVNYVWQRFGDGQWGMFDENKPIRDRYIHELINGKE